MAERFDIVVAGAGHNSLMRLRIWRKRLSLPGARGRPIVAARQVRAIDVARIHA